MFARGLFVGAICFLAVGCQALDPSVELLESELRWMEDQLYMMDRQLDKCCQQLKQSQAQNQALQKQLDEKQSSASSPTLAGSKNGTAKSNRQSAPDELDLDDLETPDVDLGGDNSSLNQTPQTLPETDSQLDIPSSELDPGNSPPELDDSLPDTNLPDDGLPDELRDELESLDINDITRRSRHRRNVASPGWSPHR